MAKKAQASVDSERAVRAEKIEELSRDLDRIRHRKFGALYYGLWWGLIICIILLAVGIALFYGLGAFDLLPKISFPGWVTPEKLTIAAICAPLLGSVISGIVAILRAATLKRKIARLEALQAA